MNVKPNDKVSDMFIVGCQLSVTLFKASYKQTST